MGKLSKPMREETEHTRERAKLMFTPAKPRKVFAELSFMRAKPC
jgi:hypothetical protein